MNSTIQSYEGGKDGAGTAGATTTGYYLKKYMNETVSLTPSNEKKKPHHFIIFRYAEILLNYAEAMDAWKGADYTDNDHPLSARAALNQVRSAADMLLQRMAMHLLKVSVAKDAWNWRLKTIGSGTSVVGR